MTPLIVTNVAGEKRRLNPLAVVGWSGDTLALPDGTRARGTLVAMISGGPVLILESETQFDWLFERATEAKWSAEQIAAFRDAFIPLVDRVDPDA